MSSDSGLDLELLQNRKFTETYRCFPLVKRGQKKLERGGKLLLPISALQQIDILDIPFPLVFKVTNDANNRSTHAGVVEFTAEEGQINAPSWLMKFLNLKPGDDVTLESVSLPSGTYCKIEALTRNFAYISDATIVLEQNLKYFSCLTEGDILFIHEPDQNQVYKLKVIKTLPETAVNIFDCEMELELSIPEKFKPQVSGAKCEREANKNTTSFKPFQGQGHRLDGTSEKTSSTEKPQKVGKTFKPNTSKSNSTGLKRKNDNKDGNKSPKKKKCKEDNQTDNTNNLVFIREKQKEFVKRQSSEKLEPFQGQGHALKDN